MMYGLQDIGIRVAESEFAWTSADNTEKRGLPCAWHTLPVYVKPEARRRRIRIVY
jgi:hypothetical protein